MSRQIDIFDVGPSRDGDQFHYSRASRLCLELLEASSDLKVVSVEGVSKKDSINSGIESIDLALYYGSTSLSAARLVRYRQLKHSTLHSDKEWTASGLRKTLKDFADRFMALVGRFGIQHVCACFAFEFETNRPLSPRVLQTLADLRGGKHGLDANYISRVTGLVPADLQTFASLFWPITRVEGFLEQRALLSHNLRAYLPDNDKDAAIALRDLVARKATTEFKSNREIRREDVLDTIGVRLGDLFPAPNALEAPPIIVPRAQMSELVKVITKSLVPVIVSADGGYGKSIVATQIGPALPGSMTFVYDCFGNGGYRSVTGLRHRAKDGLVQLANEMAAQGLCHPLIPTPKADDAAYAHAFMARVGQASAVLRTQAADARLVLVLDAADNAEMAAEEFHDTPSFPRLLLAECFPDNVRLVLTARPHRIDKLQPPPGVVHFELGGFTEIETGELLRTHFPDAREIDVREFHRLTSRNPRVQRAALDLEPAGSLAAVLRSLGPSPRTVDDTIGDLLDQAIRQARHFAAEVERPQIDRICAALAILRPFVPIRIIALTAGVDEGLVRNFSHDLGRPLLVRDDSVQFRDEPTETWFQKHFRPKQEELEAFVRRLKPLARESRYAASALPALMLSTDCFDELVRLALGDDALPENDEIARRDVELQRLEFATRAALRACRYADAAKLALKAGGRVAADSRQQALLSGNVDLASQFLDADQLLEQVSRRQIVGGNWTGSEHAYEAALLSGRKSLEGEARAQLRFAYDWLGHWFRNLQESDNLSSVTDEDILELEWAELNVHGPMLCATQLRRWQPRELSYRVGRPLAKRLVDAARWEDAAALAMAAGNDIGLVLAIADELRAVERHVPRAAALRTIRLLLHSRVKLSAPGDWRGEGLRISAVASMIDTGRHYRLASKRALAGLLRRYMPKVAPYTLTSEHSSEDRFAHLRAYSLLAALLNKPLTLEFIYGAKRKSRKNPVSKSRVSGHGFDSLKTLLPWHELNVKVRSGVMPKADFEAATTVALQHWMNHRYDYHERPATANGVARLWSECIVLFGSDEALWARLEQWQEGLRKPLSIPIMADIARRAALTGGPPHFVLSFAHKARCRIGEEAELAESMADSFVLLARAVLGASEDEAEQYFNEAVRVASKIGQENLERWHALLHLSDACAADKVDDPLLAYRFARAAEVTRSYVDRDKHFDWDHTVEAIATLSPRTSVAIISRWRDRQFGEPGRLFPQLVEILCVRGHLDARDAAALICFEGRWNWPGLIAAALDTADGGAEKEKVLGHFYQYLRFSCNTKALLKEVADAVQARDLNAQRFRKLEELGQSFELDRESSTTRLTSKRESGPDWCVIFAGLDLSSESALFESQARMPGGVLGQWRKEWIGEAVARVTAGKERSFVESLKAIDDWSPYVVRSLLELIPATWTDRLAARQALASFVRRMARDHATSFDINRHYQSLPYDLVFEKTGVTRQELLKLAVEAIADTCLPTTSNGLFQLVAVLAQFLDPAEARSVLGYGLEHLEEALGCEQGDGPWNSGLLPAGGCRESVAGYIWAALGSVESGNRWRAAHAVRALCHLSREALLEDVLMLATGVNASAFTDASFHFYRMHAVQWLLIALDRASRESGGVVSRHTAWLESLASRQNRHVVCRSIAARTLLSLAEGGHLVITPVTSDALIRINASPLPTQYSAYHSRVSHSPLGSDDTCDFSFDYDFSRDWIESLSKCFSIPPSEIKVVMCRIIREDWKMQENGHYDRDARALRGQFKEYGSKRGSELSGPDNLSFYLSYHAVMEAAGQLLETHPLHEDAEDSWGSFFHWLEYRALVGARGEWLADHRQTLPFDTIEFPARKKDAWPVPTTNSYILSRVQPRTETVVVAGSWTQYQGDNSETLRVISALASRPHAGALSRALATCKNPFDYALPEFQDTHEIHHGDFILKGWVAELGTDASADSDDPWAGGLAGCFPSFAELVAADLGVVYDEVSDTWHQDDGTCVAWVERWSEGSDNDRQRAPRGQRLVVDRQFLQKALYRQERTLILEVTCHRRAMPFNYESRSKDAKEERSTSIITIEKAGAPRIVGRNARPRRKARRGTKTR
ncbi:hypothetical protein [Pseudomonas syringae]|uniref:hypothetical protein n=1 Tax=Pseudomonas syringae TaxID=317 RepID=UPI001013992B|nr:hypothetical protein [Pseudomonas syringae]RXT59624.1 hypothetical protein B1F74_27755 [Pseudomonas syringae]